MQGCMTVASSATFVKQFAQDACCMDNCGASSDGIQLHALYVSGWNEFGAQVPVQCVLLQLEDAFICWLTLIPL